MEAPPRRPRKPWDTPSNALERITSTGMGILQRQAHHMIHIGVIADHEVVIADIFEAVAGIEPAGAVIVDEDGEVQVSRAARLRLGAYPCHQLGLGAAAVPEEGSTSCTERVGP